MPKKAIFKKEQIHNKAFEMFEKYGLDEITARNLAKALNCSPAPIYSCYSSMDELKTELIEEAKKIFLQYVMEPETDMVFLNSGIGLCRFAKDEKQLFKSIFLRDNSYANLLKKFRDVMRVEMEKDERFNNLPIEFKYDLFLDCWLIGHGLATLIATDYFENPTNEFIKDKLLNTGAVLLYKKLDDFKSSIK
ncbi:TetR/AcrR family transcriptional regulator [Cetobacterium sp.]|uniref:TetR/AcrR family transcriptional regulator n=1 Tax=Cetobacterium sp. TaxID=2071632 RepID=UPI003F40524D